MEKHVAVQADFTDALYIERAGLQSAAVWCQTAVLHRGATVVRSTEKRQTQTVSSVLGRGSGSSQSGAFLTVGALIVPQLSPETLGCSPASTAGKHFKCVNSPISSRASHWRAGGCC